MIVLVSGNTTLLRQILAQRRDVLGHLLTPETGNAQRILSTGLPWAADNGAFTGFDAAKFNRFLARITGLRRCLFVTAPDAVADARKTLALYEQWEPTIRAAGLPVAFVLQDGQENLELPDADAYFIGGSTQFKLSQAAATCADEGHARGAWIHMGRVNSHRRLKIAHEMAVHSVDGSSLSKFGAERLVDFCRWAKQLDHHQPLF